MENRVEPRTLAGFMELLPEKQIEFNRMKDIIRKNYEKYGFLPLNTPNVELAEVLLAKAGGETEKQIYEFQKGDKKLALRFDLTVPLAKYVTEYYQNLSFPFRRYQIGKVYRGEKTQKGRFREFYQCDIDIIGDGELGIVNDAEIPSVIYNLISDLGFNDFTICINNRKVLNGLFREVNQEPNAVDIMRTIDKLAKIGKENVILELKEIGVDEQAIDRILKFIEIDGTTDEKIAKLKELGIKEEMFVEGLAELEQVVKYIRVFGVPDTHFKIDLTIARGLDYYTGTVYETFLKNHREIGSICSGGRYENLADFYTNKKLPGVGISIGLTRLFDQLDNLGLLKYEEKSIAKVLVVSMNEDVSKCFEIATILRNNNINTEVYLNDKKLKTKFKYADKLKIPYVVVIGEDEINTNTVKIKNMNTGDETSVELDAKKICEIIK